MDRAWVTWTAAAVLLLGAGSVGCGRPYLHAVDDGVYGALLPRTEQWAEEGSEGIPGGYAALSADGAERVVLRIEDDTVTFELDGESAVTRQVVQRRDIQDSEGSGPFKADSQALALGDEPLVLGSLTISDPVIWYAGGYDSTEVVAIKPWDPEERGPIVQCAAADEQCLALPVGESLVGDPIGDYTDMTRPGAAENPVTGIRVTATDIVYTLDTGQEVRSSRAEETLIQACALWKSAVWPVPAEIGLSFDEPVLVETSCPLPSGEAPRLTVMERASLPVLAPLEPHRAGQWCQPGPDCLWFVDEEGGPG
ncbi:hypothetical protein LSI54_07050 [Nesterenkonia sp. AY15]|uniref:hypothetical protein n=1 Tax=Nesterenkonia sp. AY15 TaxID=2901139 RepID=UPI001F4CFA3C|nr:hypothetical protein [Nesterenkonia sp. AY15]MCH8571116.1 hypothetical protein [Nesterenkonia sp. AY15]